MSKSDLSPIEKSVEDHLRNIFPDQSEIKLVIGVSGGADSMCLFHILHKLDIELFLIHINYQKRGAESAKDARLVKQVTGDLGVDYEIITVDPDEAGSQNFQQWARNVRYQAFQLKALEINAVGIVTAHHQDDQIETILQKLFRGGGLASWRGMQVWDGQLFRPLLHIDRKDIEEYCEQNSIPFRTDETNLSSDYTRNFLRNDWLPAIKEHFPGWQKNILRVAKQADVFASSLSYIFNAIIDDKERIYRQKFLDLDEGLQKALLLYYAEQIDQSQEISRDALGELSKLPGLQTGKSIQLTETLELMRDRNFLKLVVDTGDNGSYMILKKEEIKRKGFSFNGLEFRVQPYQDPDFNEGLYLNLDALQWPIHLRRWNEGDRFQPFGMEGHQTVADHLTNRKIGAVYKSSALVLESFEETICAVIFPPIENRVPPGTISELVRCTPSTRKCLTIKRIS